MADITSELYVILLDKHNVHTKIQTIPNCNVTLNGLSCSEISDNYKELFALSR